MHYSNTVIYLFIYLFVCLFKISAKPALDFLKTFIIYKAQTYKYSSFVLFCLAALLACGILVSRPGIEPGPPAVRAQSPNHWTAREFPIIQSFKSSVYLCYF